MVVEQRQVESLSGEQKKKKKNENLNGKENKQWLNYWVK